MTRLDLQWEKKQKTASITLFVNLSSRLLLIKISLRTIIIIIIIVITIQLLLLLLLLLLLSDYLTL